MFYHRKLQIQKCGVAIILKLRVFRCFIESKGGKGQRGATYNILVVIYLKYIQFRNTKLNTILDRLPLLVLIVAFVLYMCFLVFKRGGKDKEGQRTAY